MNLKKLKERIEILEHNLPSVRKIDKLKWVMMKYEIKGIKETVEAVDKAFPCFIEYYPNDIGKWEDIKKLLGLK